jgi:hypothetical protein
MIAKCRELAEDADFPTVKRCREAGGKVVDHFQVCFPKEIIHAAGDVAAENTRRTVRAAPDSIPAYNMQAPLYESDVS